MMLVGGSGAAVKAYLIVGYVLEYSGHQQGKLDGQRLVVF